MICLKTGLDGCGSCGGGRGGKLDQSNGGELNFLLGSVRVHLGQGHASSNGEKRTPVPTLDTI
jgi:hypothetical protein